MGASGWSYFVPYQPDVVKALQELRWKVFRDGKYQPPLYQNADDISPDRFIPPGDNFTEEDLEGFRESYERGLSLARIHPETPDQLQKKCGESGTHSIIDITDVITADEDDARFGPLPAEELQALFDTDQPSHDQVLSREREIQLCRGRWCCTYVIVYRDDQPDEIFFSGYSGD